MFGLSREDAQSGTTGDGASRRNWLTEVHLEGATG